MARIRLSTGREISIRRLNVRSIYGGFLEGTPELITRANRMTLHDALLGEGWNPVRMLILEPPEPVWPPYRCAASFHSSPIKPENFCSDLSVCWFLEEIDLSLPELSRRVLETINWDSHAEDTHINDV